MFFMQTTRAMDAPIEQNGHCYNPLFSTGPLDYLIPTCRKEIDIIVSSYKQLDILNQRGIKPPSPIALYGPPGVGKSYTAKAMAEAMGIKYKKYNYEDMLAASMTKENQVNIVILLERFHEIFDQAEKTQNSPYMIIINNLDHLASFNNYLHDIALARTMIKIRLLSEIKERAKRNFQFLVVCEHKEELVSEKSLYKHSIAIATENHEKLFLAMLQYKRFTVDTTLDLKTLKLGNKTPAFLKEMGKICARMACVRNDTTINQEDIRFACSCLTPKPKSLTCRKSLDENEPEANGKMPDDVQRMFV